MFNLWYALALRVSAKLQSAKGSLIYYFLIVPFSYIVCAVFNALCLSEHKHYLPNDCTLNKYIFFLIWQPPLQLIGGKNANFFVVVELWEIFYVCCGWFGYVQSMCVWAFNDVLSFF